MSILQTAFLDPRGAPQFAQATITFTGAANFGAVGAVPMFTVSGGAVLVRYIAGRVTTNLAGATAQISLGITGITALFIALTTATTMLTSAELWVSATPTAAGLALPAATKDILIDANIIGTVGTAAVSSGVLVVDVVWEPITAGATVT